VFSPVLYNSETHLREFTNKHQNDSELVLNQDKEGVIFLLFASESPGRKKISDEDARVGFPKKM